MPGLRMQAHIEPVGARHVHVEVLEQLRHLADEDVATPLCLHEVEGTQETPVRPARERGHSGWIPRITTSTSSATAATTTATATGHTTGAIRRRAGATRAIRATPSAAEATAA